MKDKVVIESPGLKTKNDEPTTIDSLGTKYWRNENGDFHRENDLPAVEFFNGEKRWYKNGELYRKDGPSIIFSDKTEFWYKNGELHRLDGPAWDNGTGSQEWYKNGKRHRLDGPSHIGITGNKSW